MLITQGNLNMKTLLTLFCYLPNEVKSIYKGAFVCTYSRIRLTLSVRYQICVRNGTRTGTEVYVSAIYFIVLLYTLVLLKGVSFTWLRI